MDEPMIYTTKGNLPLAGLRPVAVWTDNDDETILASELWDGEDCVRREVHVYKRRGVEVGAAIGLAG